MLRGTMKKRLKNKASVTVISVKCAVVPHPVNISLVCHVLKDQCNEAGPKKGGTATALPNASERGLFRFQSFPLNDICSFCMPSEK